MLRACAAIAVVFASQPSACRAQNSEYPTAVLIVDAPSGCVSDEELAIAVADRLGRPAFVSGSAELEIRVHVRASAEGRHRAHVQMLAARTRELLGTRELGSTASDCRALDDPTAVVLAIMLDVRREELPALLEPPPPPLRESEWNLRSGAHAGIVLGLLPQPGLEVAVSIGPIYAHLLDVTLELAFDWTERVAAAEGEILIHAAAARIVVAPILLYDPIELALRLSVGAGPMWGRGSRVPDPRPTQVLAFIEARAGLRLSGRLIGPLWLEANAELGVVPLRPAFFVREGDGSTTTLFEPFIITGVFGVGAILRTD